MASGLSCDDRVLKCKKCRQLLVEEPSHKILDLGGEDAAEEETSNVFIICDDNLPDWISDAVEEVNFIFELNIILAHVYQYHNCTFYVVLSVSMNICFVQLTLKHKQQSKVLNSFTLLCISTGILTFV